MSCIKHAGFSLKSPFLQIATIQVQHCEFHCHTAEFRLASMDTDLILDLFKRTSEEEDAALAAKKRAKESLGPVSQKHLLQGLDLSSFMSLLRS
jgi:hypothetical protein